MLALAAIALTAAATALLLHRYPRLRFPARWLMLFVLVAHAVSTYRTLWPTLNWAESLPLHLCNLVLVLLAWMLVAPNVRLGEIIYYWGLGGALPALLTPDLSLDFPSHWYFMFFIGHGLGILAVVVALAGAGMRPGPGSALRAWVALLGYVAVIGTLDAVTGWNYGYMMRPPAGDTMVRHFGPWPVYIGVTLVVAAGIFLVLWWPWKRFQVRKE